MKIIYSLIFLSLHISALSQDIPSKKLLGDKFKDSTLYLIGRGTKTKLRLIADTYNLKEKDITHIGIGIYLNKRLRVFNVSDIQDNSRNALKVDSFESYTNSSDVYSLAIWECKLNKSEFSKALSFLDSISTQKIYFDHKFNLENNNVLYCSEFCVLVLKTINKIKFSFSTTVIKITDLFTQYYLKRDILEYYPVDFFIYNKSVEKVGETYFFNNK